MFPMNSVETRRIFSLPEYSKGESGRFVVEMDQESNGSSAEEVESPRSVAEVVVDKCTGRSYKERAHSQILRIRAEDLYMGEDILEGKLNLKDKLGIVHFMLSSRPILPASPLSGKTTINQGL